MAHNATVTMRSPIGIAVILACTLMLCSSVDCVASVPAVAPAVSPSPGTFQGFIRVQNQSFVDDNCHEFFPVGWNV